jgi:hypothetical protein
MSLSFITPKKILLFLILYQYSLTSEDFCYYKEARKQNELNKTDLSYLSHYNGDDSKMQKCFSLSYSDVFNKFCCYNNNTKTCVEEPETTSNIIFCPQESKIINNCGMAGFYQPVTPERCTEISLVDGFCCYVKTKNYGTGCVRQKEIDEENKNAITDEIKNYLKKLQTSIPSDDIEMVKCKGNLLTIKFYKMLFLIATIIAL